MKKAQIVKDRIKVLFSFDPILLQNIKGIKNRKYDSKKKCWYIPNTTENIIALEHMGFIIKTQEIPFIRTKNLIKKELFPYQKKGVALIEKFNGRVLLADEMGLGKTIQVLAWLELHKEIRPVVIITPATAKWNWAKEINECCKKLPKVTVIEGTPKNIDLARKKLKGKDIIIINYDIISNKIKKIGKRKKIETPKTGWVDFLQEIKPQCIALDECHYIKNSGAFRTYAVKKLCKNVPYFIGISGTPILNKPIEIYNVLHILAPTKIPNFYTFTRRYCNAHFNGFGWDYTGASNTEELHDLLLNVGMIRRLKKDVLPELPEKIYSCVILPLENKKEYEQAEKDFIKWVKVTQGTEKAEKAKRAETLVKIGTLRQLAVKNKMKAIFEWIDDFLDTDNKIVLFAEHKKFIDMLEKKYSSVCVKIDGGVTNKKRIEIMEQFQNDPKIKIFIGNMKAAGTVITLTAASHVAFLEFPWTPGDIKQAEDRCHRVGQKKAVNVYFLCVKNTIEEKIADILQKKMKVLESVLDGKEIENTSVLTDLLQEYIN